MVKPPKIRHSKSLKEPLTIVLGPGEVSRIDDPAARTEARESAANAGSEAVQAETEGLEASNATDSTTAAAKPEAVVDPTEETVSTRTFSSEPDAPSGETDAEPAQATGPGSAGGPPTQTDRPTEEEAINFMGSEWPPEPSAATGEKRPEEEHVRHAFGRDPDTPPPGATARQRQPEIAPEPQARRSMPPIAAGIVGGVIALLGAGALQWTGLLPSGSVSAPAGDGEAIAALKAEVEALKQDVAVVKAAPGGDSAALSQSVTDLRGSVQGLATALDQAKGDIATLKDAVAQGSAGDGAAVQALNQKLTELEASLATLKDVVGQGGGNDAAVQALNQRFADLQTAVAALQQAGDPKPAIDAINQQLAAMESTVAAAADAAKAGEARIGALEQNLASLSEQVAGQAAQPKVALAIAGAALKAAIERGGTFTAEVETFAAIAPNAPELPALREIASKGVASRAELAEGMDAAANAMIAASEALPDQAGFWDRLLASAESLIKVRPIGAVEGETVPAKVARMEVAVKAGDFAKAIGEYESLPEASKAAGQAFAESIKARVAAEELVAKALAGALKSA